MTFRTRALALALLPLAYAAASAQTPLQSPLWIDDPANLMGERVSAPSPADNLPINHGAPALQQLLLKLRTRASLMLIVAHPDDEDGGMLTYESRGQGARVANLTLTRGEGGQNLMSADFNDALGLIRTQELLAADRYFGVDQFFGTEVDFGFSKTKEETLVQWTHDRVLYDAVRAVRLYRPLVLTAVFVGGPTDGHGQHQVSGEICQEVFLAAADPKVFPEMGLPPWAPLKVYARVPFSRVTPEGMFDYATGKTIPTRFHNYVTNRDTTTEPVATVQIHEGEKSTALGMDGDTYVQFARKGLALQKTQIGSGVRLAPAGAFDSGYTLIASRVGCPPAQTFPCPIHRGSSAMSGSTAADPITLHTAEHSFFKDIDVSLPSLATLTPSPAPTLRPTLEAIDKHLAEAQHLFSPGDLDLTAPPLREALRSLDTLLKQTPDTPANFNLLHELRIKRVQLNNALILAHGLTMTTALTDPSSPQPLLTTQTHIAVSTEITNAGAEPVAFDAIGLPSILDAKSLYRWPHTRANIPIPPAATRTDKLASDLNPGLTATGPYFSRPDLAQPFYDLAIPALRNAPATPAPLTASAFLDDQGVELELATTVTEPANPIQPIAVVPRLSLAVEPSIGIVSTERSAQRPLDFVVTVRTNTLALKTPRIELEDGGFQIKTSGVDFTLKSVNEAHRILASLTAPNLAAGSGIPGKPQVQLFAVDPGHDEISSGYRTVGYPGLTLTNLYRPANLRVVGVDVKTAPNLRIAYLPGTGDTVPDFLPDLGITPTILKVSDLTPETLKNFDAILLGVRAYSAHPELAGPGSKPLLDFAANGGVVAVQYNSGGPSSQAAPYPFDLPGDSAHNVVEEADPVTFLAPASPILNYPNHLTQADFTGWIEEWGHGFASTWDPHYTSILEVHDPGQDPQKGGLLVARTGKGAYIYCAFALYRQLPEGVPGAYRLLANLLSYAKSPNP